jgi:uridylate kinase
LSRLGGIKTLKKIGMKTIIISLGGSLVSLEKNSLATRYLLAFRKLILKFNKKVRFFIIVGGGKLARFYQAEAKKYGVNKESLDWIGIFSCRLNAQLIRSFFGQRAYSEIITSPLAKIKTNKKIIFFSAWKPGWTTDFVTVKLAHQQKINDILNLTNIDYIFTKDPRKFKDAKPIKEITWSNYIKMVGTKHRPGSNLPFDPKASLLAKKLKIRLASINGKNLKAVENYLTDNKFIGTIVK